MRMIRFLARLPITAAATLLIAPSAPVAAVPAEPVPTLTLLDTGGKPVLETYGTTVSFSDGLGVYVGVSGADLEVRGWRSEKGPVQAAVVDPDTGKARQSVPPALVEHLEGLEKFARVTISDAGDRVVASTEVSFCPNAGRSRTEVDGPESSRYPSVCASTRYFPFLRGMVWGLERGWASSILGEWGWSFDAGKKLAPGDYTLSVRINPQYKEIFPVADDEVTLDATVVEGAEDPHEHLDAAAGSDRAAPADAAGEPGRPRHGADGRTDPPHGKGGPDRSNTDLPGGVQAHAIAELRALEEEPSPDPDTVPDLVPAPAYGLVMQNALGRNVLRFTSTLGNTGPGRLSVEGFRKLGTDRMEAYQVFTDDDGHAVGKRRVGELEYHDAPGHHHWHFLQFAQHQIVDAANHVKADSSKQSWCLLPTDPVDLTVPGADWTLDSWGEFGTQCGGKAALWVRQVLQAGWGDTYTSDLSGQSFDVTDLPNGTYSLRSTMNPSGLLTERSTANNSVMREFRIEGSGKDRRVVALPWQGIDG
ncbi:MAG: protein-lysine 6-oxidase [Acidimicrobiales bacterium]|nr:protein-lysine 6-oxidase [Acidimicrobiales bacterium]